jgi:hypothetical protein
MYVKKELDSDNLHKRISDIKTTRKKILDNPGAGSIQGIQKLRKTIERLFKEWLLDNHSKRVLLRIDQELVLDILYLEEIFSSRDL